MYVTINGSHYPCTGYSSGPQGATFTGLTGLTAAPTSGSITLCSDEDFPLAQVSVKDWARQLLEGGTLTLTNEPEPVPPTAEELLTAARAAALARLDGRCSSAIYSGVAVDGKHYKLTPTAQSNLATAKAMVDAGAMGVIYAADGEAPSLHTAAQITAISSTAYEWGVVNTSYYAALQGYIAAETDADKLAAIDYGKALPDSYMQQLTSLLSSAGIDITKYTALFTA